VILILHFTA